MSVLWLRTAAALYFCGLVYALVYLFRKNTRLFHPALVAFAVGAVFHFVSLVELHVETGHLPLYNFYETSSACAFLIAVIFLAAYSYYRIAIFSICLFPLVFFMTLIGATEFPVASWSSPQIRNIWLTLHIATVLIGYAALLLSAVASIYYLLQERQLKQKKYVTPSTNRLPPLATLDRLISQSMNAGFVFITIGTVTGAVWAYIESGTRWIAEPQIDFFLFTWAFYLAMIFLRVSAGWRGRRIAWLAVSVLGCSIITWATHFGLGSLLSR
jgi:ABC-type transport system involved in cytochrome c biogenesis permease subunit